MDAQEFYSSCLLQASSIINQIQADQLANETIDDEWTVRDLASHILYEVSWIPDMLAGRTTAEVGNKYEGELFDGDVANAQTNLKTAWENAAANADQAVEACDPQETAHLSYADVDNGQYLKMSGGDILVHSWDLAKAISAPCTFPADVAADMWQHVKDRDLSGSGSFKAPLQATDDASNQDKILAKFGRDINWQPVN